MSSPAALTLLRDAAFLSGARASAYSRLLLAITIAAAAAWLALSHAGVDPAGKPLGTDFISFWTASRLALEGHPAAAYDLAAHHAAQRALFGDAAATYTAFFYPPTFLLLCLPLALLPYLAALAVWLALTALALWRGLRPLLRHPGLPLAALAYPALFLNLAHGQNAFLTAALFAGAGLALPSRPVLAGALYGALIIKPHLAILVPLALIAARRWSALAAAGATATALAALSAGVFGLDTWGAFARSLPIARLALEQNLIGPEKMPSVFAALRLLHAGIEPAAIAQALVALAAAALLVQALRHRDRKRPGLPGEGALIAAATPLASPFLLDYDLAILALPLAWTLDGALRTRFLPWERLILAAAYVLPLLCRVVAGAFAIPLGPPVLAGLFLLVRRRVTEC